MEPLKISPCHPDYLSQLYFTHKMALQERHLKEGRIQCWGARDKYWKCLDANNEKLEKCVKLRKEYEKFCSQQWVKHFDRKRQFEKFKEEADLNNWEKPVK